MCIEYCIGVRGQQKQVWYHYELLIAVLDDWHTLLLILLTFPVCDITHAITVILNKHRSQPISCLV